MSKIAKISVEKFDSKDQILYDFDKTKGLEENVQIICRKFGLPESSRVYGLKFLPTKNDRRDHYVSETYIDEIKHSDCLKVVFSVKYIIERICNNLQSDNLELRQIVFEDISRFSLDPVFIQELALSDSHKILLTYFIENQLSSDQQLGLLKTIVHLFAKEYIYDTSIEFLEKVLTILRSMETTNEELRFTLCLLHKIVVSNNEAFNVWKEKIVKDVLLSELVPYTWKNTWTELQYSALLLINSIIKVCKGDKKTQLIKEMNLKKTRENIYNYIILKENLDKNMEHELYVLQTYLLSLFREALHSKIHLDDNNLFKREEFELGPDDMRRLTILMDFDDESVQNSYLSVEDLAFNYQNSRISLISLRSDRSSRVNSQRTASLHYSESEKENTISHLTLEALRHYKNLHPQIFYQSQIEEQFYEPGIFVTSERVVKMLAKMLHIGLDPPDGKSTFYQPVVYFCSSKTPFFLELFSKTMWLLSKTRREMKASTYADYEKVMYILQKQVRTVLKNKPKNFESLDTQFKNTSFSTVIEKIQKDKEEEMKLLLETHPCMQELKQKYCEPNKLIVFNQRMKVLFDGEYFPVLEKKATNRIFVKLSSNRKELMVFKVYENNKHLIEKFNVDDVSHVVIGKNCQHSNISSNPALAFSVLVKVEEKIKFIAKDEKTACYWIDALFLLLGKATNENLSKYYKEELDQLIETDIRLQLLELQNVHIPKTPPPVPPLPSTLKPVIPPKPKLRK